MIEPPRRPRTNVAAPSKTFRMRGRDTTLNEMVFWNAPVLDSAGNHYAGPGPLVDVIVAKTFQG